jgi:hypothetical protein
VSAIPATLEEFCASCGEWVSYLNFDYGIGWCNECSGVTPAQEPRCTRCGAVLDDQSRTTCHTCRQEQWLERYADELELLIVAKGHSVSAATAMIVRMSRPICQWCRSPIVGGREGALFHGRSHKNRQCHARYRMFVRLRKQGMSVTDALDLTVVDRPATMYYGR